MLRVDNYNGNAALHPYLPGMATHFRSSEAPSPPLAVTTPDSAGEREPTGGKPPQEHPLSKFIEIAENLSATRVCCLTDPRATRTLYIFCNSAFSDWGTNSPLINSLLDFADSVTIWSGGRVGRMDRSQTAPHLVTTREYTRLNKLEFDQLLKISALDWGPPEITRENMAGTLFKLTIDRIIQPDEFVRAFRLESHRLLLFSLSLEQICLYRVSNLRSEVEFSVSIPPSSLPDARRFRRCVESAAETDSSEQSMAVSHMLVQFVSQDLSQTQDFVIVLIIGHQIAQFSSLIAGACASVTDPTFCSSIRQPHASPSVDNSGLPVLLNVSAFPNHGATSNEMIWGQPVVREVLSRAYSTLMREFIEHRLVGHDLTYSLFPDLDSVDPSLADLSENVLRDILQSPTSLFIQNMRGGYWTAALNAFVLDGTTWSFFNEPLAKISSQKFMFKENIAIVPKHVFQSLRKIFQLKLRILTPAAVRFFIRGVSLEFLSKEERLNLLKFVSADNSLRDLIGLELVPIGDGEFREIAENVNNYEIYENFYDFDSEMVDMWKEKFVSPGLTPDIRRIFREISLSGCSQIRTLGMKEAFQMLLNLLDRRFPDNKDSAPEKCRIAHFIWELLKNWPISDIRTLSDVPMIPSRDADGQIRLVSFDGLLIASAYNGESLEKSVCDFLVHLGVAVVWDETIIHVLMETNSAGQTHLHPPNAVGISDVFHKIVTKLGSATIKRKIQQIPSNLCESVFELISNDSLGSNLLMNGLSPEVNGQPPKTEPGCKSPGQSCNIHTTRGTVKSSLECVDPRDGFMAELMKGMDVFVDENRLSHGFLASNVSFKTAQMVTATDLKNVVDLVSASPPYCSEKQIESCLALLESNPSILQEKVDDHELRDHLMSSRWLPAIRIRPTAYPECLPWFGESQDYFYYSPPELQLKQFSILVGSVAGSHKFGFSPQLASALGISAFPPPATIGDHYAKVTEMQASTDLETLNRYMCEYYGTWHRSAEMELRNLGDSRFPDNWLWDGSQFVDHRRHCLYLTTFLKPFADLLDAVGAGWEDDFYAFMGKMKEKYSSKKCVFASREIQTDLLLIVSSAEEFLKKPKCVDLSKIPLPIFNNSAQKISFSTGDRCICCPPNVLKNLTASQLVGMFCKSNILHQQFPLELAEKLGIKILDHDLVDSSGREERKVNDQCSVVREIFRLAESVGCSEIKFMYDMRNLFSMKKESVYAAKSSSFWIHFNSSVAPSFFDDIGRLDFLRFISDKIMILTRNSFVTYNFNSDQPPLKLNTMKCSELTMEEREVISGFNGIFGSRISPNSFYSGTLIRCPLNNNSITNFQTRLKTTELFVRELFRNIVDLSVKLMLYLDTIFRTSIYRHKYYDIDDCELLFSLQKYCSNVLQAPIERTIRHDLIEDTQVDLGTGQNSFRFHSLGIGRLFSLYSPPSSLECKKLVFSSLVYNFKGSLTKIGSEFIDRTDIKDLNEWALFVTIQQFELRQIASCVAVLYRQLESAAKSTQLGETTYPSLEMEKNGMPVDLYFCFDQSNSFSKIDVSRPFVGFEMLADAYLVLIEYLTTLGDRPDSAIYKFWPMNVSPKYSSLASTIYQKIFSKCPTNSSFFPFGRQAVSPEKIIVFHGRVDGFPILDDIIPLYERIFDHKVVTNIPEDLIVYIKDLLPRDPDFDRIFDINRLLNTILQTPLADIEESLRDRIVICALAHFFEDVGTNLRSVKCIPVSEDELQSPCSLIDPMADFRFLFDETPCNVFPKTNFASKPEVMKALRTLGMAHDCLSWSQIGERVQHVVSTDSNALKTKKITILFKYIHRLLMEGSSCPTGVHRGLLSCPILPVRANRAALNPTEFADSTKIYLPDYEFLVSILWPIIDLDSIPVLGNSNILHFLNIVARKPTADMVIDNLLALAKIHDLTKLRGTVDVEEYCHQMYIFLESYIDEPNNVDFIAKRLRHHDWIYFGGDFFPPRKICFSQTGSHFPPYVYNLSSSWLTRHEHLICSFGGKKTLTKADFGRILKQIEFDTEVIDSALLETYNSILLEFVNHPESSNVEEYQQRHGPIHLPDTGGNLLSVSCLLYDDCGMEHSPNPHVTQILSQFHIVHPIISLGVSTHLGVQKLSDEVVKCEKDTKYLFTGLSDRVFPADDQLVPMVCAEMVSLLDFLGCSDVKITFDGRTSPNTRIFDERFQVLSRECLFFEVDRLISNDEINLSFEKYFLHKSPLNDQGSLGFVAAALLSPTAAIHYRTEQREALEIVEFEIQSDKLMKKTTTKYKNLDVLKNLFPQSLHFLGRPLREGRTIFRLPLTAHNIVNRRLVNLHQENCSSFDFWRDFANFPEVFSKQIIFLENIRSISLWDTHPSGIQARHSTIQLTIGAEEQTKLEEHRQNLLRTSPIHRSFCLYEAAVVVDESHLSSWFCCDMTGFESAEEMQAVEAQFFPSPRVLVALGGCDHSFPYIFCSGSLVGSQSLLPRLLIGGNFVIDPIHFQLDLTVSRRNDWNLYLLLNMCPQSHLLALDLLRKSLFSRPHEIYSHFPSFPFSLVSPPTSQRYLSKFYQLLYDGRFPLFPRGGVETMNWEFADSVSFDDGQLESEALRHSLEGCGMKIVSIPGDIWTVIKEYNPRFTSLSVGGVLSYFRQQGRDSGEDDYGARIKSNLSNILMFLVMKGEEIDLTEIPLVMTADCRLTLGSSDNPKYLFEYHNIFGDTRSLFVHTGLLEIYRNPKFAKCGVFEKLDARGLGKLLTRNEKLKSQLTVDPQNSFIIYPTRISSRELQTLWSSVDSVFMEYCHQNEITTTEEISSHFVAQFRPIDHWCILPTVTWDPSSETLRRQLVSVKRYNKIIRIHGDDPVLRDFLIHAGVTQPDKSIIDCWFYDQIVGDQFYSAEQTLKILIRTKAVPTEPEFAPVLRFVSEILQSRNRDSVSPLLPQLKIYRLLDGQMSSLVNVQPQICTENDISLRQVDKWCMSDSLALLDGEMMEYPLLLNSIGCKNVSITTVYLEMILPRFGLLAFDSQYDHLRYLRDLLGGGSLAEDECSLLVKRLRVTPLIFDRGGSLRVVGDIFDPEWPDVLNLSKLNDKIEFPVVDYSTEEWLPFLRRLNLRNELPHADLVTFGQMLADQQSEMAETVSHSLYNCLVQSTKTENEANSFGGLQFLPNKYDSPLYPHKNGGLIALKGSTPWKNRKLAWTVMPILPEWIEDTAETHHFLEMTGVVLTLKPESVIQNLANISSNLESPGSTTSFENVCDVLFEAFSFLSRHHTDYPLTGLRELCVIPTTSGKIVKPGLVVFKSAEEIPNYMETVNPRFMAFPHLFFGIGIPSVPDIGVYSRILSDLRRECKILTPNEMSHSIKCTKGILMELIDLPPSKINEKFNSLTELYLPRRNGTLQSSSSLVYIDTINLLQRMSQLDCPLLVSCRECGLSRDQYVQAMGRIPAKLRPTPLSRVLVEKIDSNSINPKPRVVEDSFPAQIKSRLGSDRFLSGMGRILNLAAMDAELTMTSAEIQKYKSKIQSAEIIHLYTITTYLFYEDQIVPNTECTCDCFYHPNGENAIYLRHHTLSETRMIVTLSSILSRICDDWLEGRRDLVVHILTCPLYDIERELNYLLVPPCEETLKFLSTLPTPGSAIPPSHYDFLYSNCGHFKFNEFVGILRGETELVYGLTVGREDEMGNLWSVNVGGNTNIKVPWDKLIKITAKCFGGTKYSLRAKPEKESKARTPDPTPSSPNSQGSPPTKMNYSENLPSEPPKAEPKYRRMSFNSSTETGENLFRRSSYRHSEFFFPQANSIPEVSKPSPIKETIPEESENVEDIKEDIRRRIKHAKQLTLNERKKLIKKLFRKWHPDKNPNNLEVSTAIFQLIQIEIESNGLFDESKKNPWEYMGFSGWDNFYEFVKKKAKSKESDTTFPETPIFKETKPRQNSSESFNISVIKSNTWFAQAKSDLETASTLDFGKTGSYEWMSFIACQAVEKAIKAVYIRMANTRSVDHMTSLSILLFEIRDDKLTEFSKSLEQINFRTTRGLCPEKITAPHKIATPSCGQSALVLAKTVVDYVQRKYFNNSEFPGD